MSRPLAQGRGCWCDRCKAGQGAADCEAYSVGSGHGGGAALGLYDRAWAVARPASWQRTCPDSIYSGVYQVCSAWALAAGQLGAVHGEGAFFGKAGLPA